MAKRLLHYLPPPTEGLRLYQGRWGCFLCFWAPRSSFEGSSLYLFNHGKETFYENMKSICDFLAQKLNLNYYIETTVFQRVRVCCFVYISHLLCQLSIIRIMIRICSNYKMEIHCTHMRALRVVLCYLLLSTIN